MTLLASKMAGTKVALSLHQQFQANAAAAAQLTADASILATSHDLIQSITTDPVPAFCAAIRVRDHWWSDPSIGALHKVTGPSKTVTEATDDEFWEQVL